MIDQAAIKTGEEVRSKLLHIPDSYRSGECISIYMLYRYAEEISNMKLIETIAMQFFQRSGSVPYMLPYENKFLLLNQEPITMEQLAELHRLIASFVPYRCYLGLTHYRGIQDGDRFFIRIADSIETIGFYDCPDEML